MSTRSLCERFEPLMHTHSLSRYLSPVLPATLFSFSRVPILSLLTSRQLHPSKDEAYEEDSAGSGEAYLRRHELLRRH